MPQVGTLLHTVDLQVVAQKRMALQRVVGGLDASDKSSEPVAAEELSVSNLPHESTNHDPRSPPATANTAASGKKRTSNKKLASHKKSTYVVRKDEIRKLQREKKALQQRLAHIETPKLYGAASLSASERMGALLREAQNSEHSNPLSNNRIHLGTDWSDRRRTLLAMKRQAITRACEYVETRSRFLDPLKRHVYEERFENARGDFCCARFDVLQFSNVTSVKQVYEALITCMYNIEINVSERLGDITTRDDFDSIENSISSFRLLTTKSGIPVEKHDVLFMEYFDSHELSQGGPCGVVVIDYVDEDELYPYTPLERMRSDSSVAIVLTPHWRAASTESFDDKELVVSMAMGRFIKVHHSKYPWAAPVAVEQMRENIMGCGSLVVSVMRDSLCQSTR
ncbi:hypothetical protein Gpo141_00010999 [Globisporangium polare]